MLLNGTEWAGRERPIQRQYHRRGRGRNRSLCREYGRVGIAHPYRLHDEQALEILDQFPVDIVLTDLRVRRSAESSC